MKNLLYAGMIGMLLACAGNPGNNSAATDTVNNGQKADTFNAASPAPLADTFSLNGAWFLQPVLDSDTAAGKIPTIIFNKEKNSFSGNTGCNNMNGSFQLTDTSLVFSEKIMTTRMACPGYNEQAFISSLIRTNKYKFDKGVLVLLFDATELSRWTRRPEKEIKVKRT